VAGDREREQEGEGGAEVNAAGEQHVALQQVPLGEQVPPIVDGALAA
jgi:hypothetical protein